MEGSQVMDKFIFNEVCPITFGIFWKTGGVLALQYKKLEVKLLTAKR